LKLCKKKKNKDRRKMEEGTRREATEKEGKLERERGEKQKRRTISKKVSFACTYKSPLKKGKRAYGRRNKKIREKSTKEGKDRDKENRNTERSHGKREKQGTKVGMERNTKARGKRHRKRKERR
jgi:hypothetical protein